MASEQKRQKGFTLVELLLAMTVFALLTGGLIGAVVYGRAATANAGDHARAVFMAQEGVAAARNIGDAAYANLTLGSHGLVQSGGIWTFSGTSDTSGIYTRVVTITSGGTNRLTIASTVTWTEPGGATGSVTETGEMTNWTAAIKLWSNAILAGSVAVTGTNAALKTATQGNYAYTVLNTNTGNNFVVTNIATPTAPVNVASITLPSSELPTNITVSGNYAYVTLTHATATLAIINISNPAAPSQVGLLPKLSNTFSQLNVKLPLISVVMINFGNFLQLHGIVAVPLALGGGAVIGYILFGAPKTKFIGQRILFKLPGIGRLMKEVEIAQFGYLLGTLLDAGLPITQAVELLAGASTSRQHQRFYKQLAQYLTDGFSVKDSMSKYKKSDKLLPLAMQQMVTAGERSGSLAEVLLTIGHTYEQKSDTTTENLEALMEPVLLLFVAAGVMLVAVAVILPIYSLVGGLGA